MEKLHPIVICFSIYLLFLNFSTSQYTFPDQYFINCGSNSNAQFGQKTFIGDQTSTNSVSLAGKTQTVSTTSTTTQLYQTARVFTDPSSYELQIANNSVYIVRLHFFAFPSSSHDLSQAQFDVSASGFYLLSNFTVKTSAPVVREFLLNVTMAGKFSIFFVPRANSFAFVSAIEAFQAPPSFTNSPSGGDGSAQNALQDHILGVVHRINVGGPLINEENDTIGRNWVPDDNFLSNKNSVQNFSTAANNVKYNTITADSFNAPEPVYSTAKMMNQTSSVLNGSTFFNITWQFNVSRNAPHFVRAHFCDIVSPSVGTQTQFVLYIYQRHGYTVFPYNVSFTMAVPFYFDLLVDSDGSGIMPISIGPPGNYTAFLNGLEIMERLSALAPAVQVIGSSGSKPKTGLIVGGVVGGVAAFLAILAVAAIIWRKKFRKAKPVDNSDNWQGVSPYGGGSSYSRISDGTLNLGLRLSFADIVHATSSFDAKLIIGEGGFGKVYKGVMRDGTKVAVKRSAPGHGQGLPEFQTEIIVLSKVRYRHLVSLIGFCDEGSEMILVYEFMEKGTLREHLYVSGEGSSDSEVGSKWSPTSELSWTQRLDICIGSAKGLHYLHTSSNNGIIHRDVKSTNILLDEFLVAKVADFGLSRSGALDQTHVSTDVKGSFGYLDPEYFKYLQLTQKSDVYSFGVVLLEVLCARPAIAISSKREEVNLADWFLSCHKRGELEKIVEPSLVDKINPNSLRKFAETVEKCLKEYGVERPSMHDVLWDLEYVLQLQQTARPREAHEDSTSDVSWGMALPAVQRLPSLNDPIDEDDDEYEGSPMDSSIPMNASEVFSQLKLGGPR